MDVTVLLVGAAIWLLLATVPVALLVAAGRRERGSIGTHAGRTSEDTLAQRGD